MAKEVPESLSYEKPIPLAHLLDPQPSLKISLIVFFISSDLVIICVNHRKMSI